MSFHERMAADAAVIMDTEGGFAEWLIFNGVRIKGIFKLDEEKKYGREGNAFASTNSLTDRATLWILAADVAVPESEDIFTREGDPAGKQWHVSRVIGTIGGMHRLECTANEFPYRR